MSGKYIVVFKKTASDEVIEQHANDVAKAGGAVHSRYDTVLRGFSASIPEAHLTQLQSLQGGDIDYIEPDGVVTTQ
ncbi:serine proteinase inhibitor IA-1 [Amylostereum chailletii]|nr:serine proteinase inhibitor IA-1 [Amylostereum chailletii]